MVARDGTNDSYLLGTDHMPSTVLDALHACNLILNVTDFLPPSTSSVDRTSVSPKGDPDARHLLTGNSAFCFLFFLLQSYFSLAISILFFIFKKDLFIYFLEREEGREKERERNINVWLPLMRPTLGTLPATQACALEWGLNL